MRVAKFVEWVTSVAWSRRQTLRNRQQRPQLRLEHLEARDVPTINPTGLEQEMLELVNHMRIDPAGELNRLLVSTNPLQARDPAVQSALQYFGVSGSALASPVQADALEQLPEIRRLAEGGQAFVDPECHETEFSRIARASK